MNAQQDLANMRLRCNVKRLQTQVTEAEKTTNTLISRVDSLNETVLLQQQMLDSLLYKMRCTTCNSYLESKRPGDTIEGHQCQQSVLTTCFGIQ